MTGRRALLFALLLATVASASEDARLLKVNTVSKDGEAVVESIAYTSDMTLAGLRASAPPDSPIKWSAFCKSRTMGINVPLLPLDYEADDLSRVTSNFSADQEIPASYMFVVKDGKQMFAMPVCPYTTFTQLRDRIGHRIDSRDFTFEIDDLDEERMPVKRFVNMDRLQSVMPGAVLEDQYDSTDVMQDRNLILHITSGGPGVQRKKAQPAGAAAKKAAKFVVNKVKELARIDGEPEGDDDDKVEPHIVTCAVTMPDESLLLVPNVDINTVTVGEFREMIKKNSDDKQKNAKMHEQVALCSPYTEAELAEDDLLADHVVVSASDTVTFTCRYLQMVDWLSGKEAPVMATVCPRSSYKQLITRAAPSFPAKRTPTIYAIPDSMLLTHSVDSKFMWRSQAECLKANKPLHLRHVDSIFLNIQDGHGHRLVMVQDQKHIYTTATVYQRFEELLGRERGWSLALCVPRGHARYGAVEIPVTSSLKEYGLSKDGVHLDAMVVRVKATVESQQRTVELLMNVCAESRMADLEFRIREAVGAKPDDKVFFLSRRAGSDIIDVNDVDLAPYRTRPPVHPRRPLFAWIGQRPFFTVDRTRKVDGLYKYRNIAYTLPDETVLVFDHVDEHMPVKGLRKEIGKRLLGESLTNAVHNTMALCDRSNMAMLDGVSVGEYVVPGDNYLSMHWVTLLDHAAGNDKPVVVTACAGDTYRSLLERAAPGLSQLGGDVSQYKIQDGSKLDLTVAKEYLSDDSAIFSARTLEVAVRGERLVSVPLGDQRVVTVSVSVEATVGELRAVLAKRVGPLMAWGTGFCLPFGWEQVFMGCGELEEERKLSDLFGESASPIHFANAASKTILLRMNNSVTRIPSTVCSVADVEGLTRRLQRAVGADGEAVIVVGQDQRSPLVRFLPFVNKSTDLMYVDVILPSKPTVPVSSDQPSDLMADKPDKAGTPSKPDRAGKAQNPQALNSEAALWMTWKNVGLSIGLVIVLTVLVLVAMKSGEPEQDDQILKVNDSTIVPTELHATGTAGTAINVTEKLD